MKRSTHRCASFLGRARERNAACGSPPMAAMSLRPRVRQRQPTTSGGCHSGRKCTPSREKSVVTRTSCPGGSRRTAASSPMPAFMLLLPCRVVRRMRAINAFSCKGMSTNITASRFCRSSRPARFPAIGTNKASSTWFADPSPACKTELHWLPVPRSKWEPGPS